MAVPSFFSPAAACGSSTFLPPLLIRTQFPSCHRYFSCQTQLPYFFVHVHQQRLQRHCGESHCLAKIRRSRDANALEPGLPFLFPAFYAVVLDLLGNVNALACGDIVEKFDMRLDAILDIAQVSVGFTALSPGVMFAIVTVEAVALIGAFVGGASCQRQGKYQDAITYHSLVLEISERTGETSGNTEALGSIADCYCELGDFDMAQIFYNRYIDRLTMDDS
eukprot:c17761_g1_i1 orf=166-828(+)